MTHSELQRDGTARDDQVSVAAEIFRMLADPTRIKLLLALSPDDTELPVNELAHAAGKNASAVSQHLAKLRMIRLVTTRHQGTQVFYRVANEHVSQLVIDALRHSEHLGSTKPAHHRAP